MKSNPYFEIKSPEQYKQLSSDAEYIRFCLCICYVTFYEPKDAYAFVTYK